MQGDLYGMEPAILDSARRHGVPDEDVLHALRNTMDSFPDQGDWDLTIDIGPARDGAAMLEIGFEHRGP